ncbi:MAG TPA: cyclic nucleotide-binding domain-containing protein [Chloroflexia bacterium]|nr:cyclic nucleotide-binding domain-containing protein [Chloroflexia bacterium]
MFEQILAHHSFFNKMDQRLIDLIAQAAEFANFEAGEYLFHEGDEADRFYLIIHGKVALEINTPQQGPVVIQTIGDDQVLGWSWLFPPYRWQFDAHAAEETRAVVLDGKWLRQMCDQDHELGYQLMNRVALILLEWLQATRLQLLDVYAHSY